MRDLKRFKIMCVDSLGNLKIKTSENLYHSLMSNATLFDNPQLNAEQLTDGKTKIFVKLHRLEKIEASELVNGIFQITCYGSYEALESFRLPIIQHLTDLKFDYLYILTDDVSAAIAKELYPKIYDLENKLRKFVVKFFVTKLGPKWWDRTADSKMQEKANLRKNNETTFQPIVKNKVFSLDFGELGKIVTSQVTGFLTIEDILSKIERLEESIEAVRILKLETKPNYIKYFKDTFKKINFQKTWESLEKIRNKIARNNLFTFAEIELVEKYYAGLCDIFRIADEKFEGITFPFEQMRQFTNQSLVTINLINYWR